MHVRMAVVLLSLMIIARPGPAASNDGAGAQMVAEVVAVIDGDTVVFQGGQEVRLVGIQAPKLALGRASFPPWPLAQEAKSTLQDLVLKRRVEVHLAPVGEDRYGRLLARLRRLDDGLWVQDEMVKRGLARVYSLRDNRVLARPLLALEGPARDAQKGIWGWPFYAVRRAQDSGADIGTFQMIEGRIVDTARVKNRIYLNFGDNWRTDFTIKVNRADERLFRQAGIDLLALKGVRVRVRGWVRSRNGPMVELDHPERLERLE